MTRVLACALTLLTVPALAPPALADPVVIGGPADSNNCYPFGCGRGETGQASRYQQVYSSSQFAGPITIGAVQFYFSEFAGNPLTVGTYEFYLSTTGRQVGGLDTRQFDSNSGHDRALFTVMPFAGIPRSARAVDRGHSVSLRPWRGKPAPRYRHRRWGSHWSRPGRRVCGGTQRHGARIVQSSTQFRGWFRRLRSRHRLRRCVTGSRTGDDEPVRPRPCRHSPSRPPPSRATVGHPRVPLYKRNAGHVGGRRCVFERAQRERPSG